MYLFLANMQVLLHKTLFDGLESCGLLWCFISCLNSHSHKWCNARFLQWRNKLISWVNLQQMFINRSTITLTKHMRNIFTWGAYMHIYFYICVYVNIYMVVASYCLLSPTSENKCPHFFFFFTPVDNHCCILNGVICMNHTICKCVITALPSNKDKTIEDILHQNRFSGWNLRELAQTLLSRSHGCHN